MKLKWHFFVTEINIVTIKSLICKKNLKSTVIQSPFRGLYSKDLSKYMSPIPALICGSSHFLTVPTVKLSSMEYLHPYNQQIVALDGLKWQILTLSPQSHIGSISSLVLFLPIKQHTYI